jgi:hypothetical protein
MCIARICELLLLGLALCACSVHPLPQDVTGVKTTTIVRQNRCEARAAIIEAQSQYLTKNKYPVHNVEELRRAKADKHLDPVVAHNLAYFDTTGIVYSYSLDGTETNGLTLSGDIIEPLTHPGLVTISPSAGNMLIRDNIRTFTISDNFATLIGPKNDDYCDFPQPRVNLEYPVVGRIGIDEMVRTFIELVTKDDLAGEQDASKGLKLNVSVSSDAPIAMVDSISFTTTISAGATPKIMFSQVGRGWQLMDASLASSNSRVDKHQVFVGLALATLETQPPADGAGAVAAKGAKFTPFTASLGSLTPALISPPLAVQGSGEANAMTAVNQQIVRYQLARPLAVAP